MAVMKIGQLKRNDLQGALAVYKAGANTRDDVDMLLSLQDDPSALGKALAELGARRDYDEDQPRDEAGRWTSTGGGGGTFKEKYGSKEYPRAGLPGGRTKSEYAKLVDDKGEYIDRSHLPEHEQAKARDERYKLEAEWNNHIQREIAFGRMDPKVAEAAGWYSDIPNGEAIDLPKELWHVTTAADAVRREGLKTRAELSQANGKGLGGGPDGTISFTTDPKIADAIQNSLREFHDLLNDKVTVKDLYDRAVAGSDAKRPYADELMKSMSSTHGITNLEALLSDKVTHKSWNIGGEKVPTETRFNYSTNQDEPIPESAWKKVGEEKAPGATTPMYTFWERTLSEDEKDQRKAQFYKAYSLWRQEAGGQEDPLFFSTDVTGFKGIPRDQIQTLKFQPADKDEHGNAITPKGYRVSSLGEIRTYTGSAVKLADFDPVEHDLMKGNFGIERKDMPQFLPEARAYFLDRMESRGFPVHYNETRKASDLKATQSTLHMDVVRRMSKDSRQSPILVSEDGYVLDGHHRWAAARLNDPNAEIQTHRIGLPIKKLLREALDDPNSTRNDAVDLEDLMIKERLDAAIAHLLAQKADLERRLDALLLTHETVTRMDAAFAGNDHWKDQPRDEGGRWSETAGGGGGGDGGSNKSSGGGTSKPSVGAGAAPSKGLREISERVGRDYKTTGKVKELESAPVRKEPQFKEPRKGLKEVGERLARSEGKLPQAHDKYFNTDKPGTEIVPLDKLLTIRARPTGIENAEKHMGNAYDGNGKKRDPISVSKNDDGTYSVEDGNSTTAIARKHGWDSLPVQIVESSDKGRAAYKEHKVQQSLNEIRILQEVGRIDPKTGQKLSLSKDVSLERHREIAETEIAKHAAGLANFKETLTRVAGIEFAGRTKTLDSALGKVARKPKYGTVDKLQDLTGVRAVTESVQQSRAVAAAIAKEYNVPEKDIEEKLEAHQVQDGGYRAIHMTVRDKDGLEKEVQIQTRRQRAFQEWSHDVYKPQTKEQLDAVGTEEKPGPYRGEALAYGNAVSKYFFERDQGRDSPMPPRPHPVILKVFGTPKEPS